MKHTSFNKKENIMAKYVSIFFTVFLFFWIGCSNDNIVDGGEKITHSSNINQDEVWAKGTHYIEGYVTISNAVVTIEPGATVVFKENARLTISTNGGLIADGTSESITFTGEVEQKGYWQFIEFSSDANSAKSILKNVTIQYGGGYSSSSYQLMISNNATVRNCTIRNSSSNGVLIDAGILPDFVDNIITGNTGFPLAVDFTSIHSVLLGNGTFQGNGMDYVNIMDNTLTQNATMHKIDVPYRFSYYNYIDSPATLTIEAGNTIEMNSDSRLSVSTGAGLIADGTQTEQIVFTGVLKQAGYWQFIEFGTNANNSQCILDYVIIEYGGGYSNTSASLMIYNNATITNTIIRNSASYGCYIHYTAEPSFSDNQMTQNTAGPMYTYFSTVSSLNLNTCDFAGNTVDGIIVEGDTRTKDGTLQKTNVPYIFTQYSYIDNNATLTIEPGTIIQMDSDSRLVVLDGCALIADGTQEQITFTGRIAQNGYWQHIEFSANASNTSSLINCLIEYGGGYSSSSGLVEVSNSPIIQNCTLQHSLSHGIIIYTSTGSDINMSGNTFTDIAGSNYYYY
jgi:hypothetical protein